MDWLKSKTTVVAGGCLALIGLQGYGMMSMRSTLEERVGSVEREIQSMHNQDDSKLTQLSTDLDVVTKRMGITAQELQQAHKVAEQLKRENVQTTQRLRGELAAKADIVHQVRRQRVRIPDRVVVRVERDRGVAVRIREGSSIEMERERAHVRGRGELAIWNLIDAVHSTGRRRLGTLIEDAAARRCGYNSPGTARLA